MGAPRIDETKLTSENAFVANFFASGDERESKYDEKALFSEVPRGVMTCLLTLSLRKMHISIAETLLF